MIVAKKRTLDDIEEEIWQIAENLADEVMQSKKEKIEDPILYREVLKYRIAYERLRQIIINGEI